MQLDGLSLHFIINEIKRQSLHGRLVKITQISNKSFLFVFRANQENFSYFLSLDANEAYLGPASSFAKNYKEKDFTSPFLLVLRKYLQGALLLNLACYKTERLVYFDFEHHSELGDKKSIRLVVELMGRQSNLILLNNEGIILDSLLHIDFSQSKNREIMPARAYTLPIEKKESLLSFSKNSENLKTLHQLNTIEEKTKFLREKSHGISPLFLKYLQELPLGFEEALRKLVENLEKGKKHLSFSMQLPLEQQKNFKKALQENFSFSFTETAPLAFYPFEEEKAASLLTFLLSFQKKHFLSTKENLFVPYATIGEENSLGFYDQKIQVYFSFSRFFELLSIFLKENLEQKLWKKKKSQIENYLKDERKTWQKKKAIYLEDLQKSEHFLLEKKKGELLLCQTENVQTGKTFLEMEDLYAETPSLLSIALDPSLNLYQNAENYFRRAKKLQQKNEIASKLLQFAFLQESYLDSVAFQLEECTGLEQLEALLEEIRFSKENELTLQDFIQHYALENIFEKNEKKQTFSTKKSFSQKQEEKRKAKSVGKPANRSKAFSKYIQLPKKKKEKLQFENHTFQPRKFLTSQGLLLEIGKNNFQNDALVQKAHQKEDLWLHAQNRPGPHALLHAKNGEKIDDTSLLEAAQMLAFYSLPFNARQKKNSVFEKTSVLYTYAHFVKKIKKGKPGLVQIKNEKSLLVMPAYVLEALPNPTDDFSQS